MSDGFEARAVSRLVGFGWRVWRRAVREMRLLGRAISWGRPGQRSLGRFEVRQQAQVSILETLKRLQLELELALERELVRELELELTRVQAGLGQTAGLPLRARTRRQRGRRQCDRRTGRPCLLCFLDGKRDEKNALVDVPESENRSVCLCVV